MGREVEVLLPRVEMMLYHLSDTFMIKEGEKLMKGSVHEEDLFIVHDDLVLMTEKETITWTRDNNYFHRWFMTMNTLQYGTPYTG